MFGKFANNIAATLLLALAVFGAVPAAAQQAGLQCVPYARQLSGIQIYGDAHTWWKQAAGKYARGSTPRVGAVMSFKPHRNSRLGHVAYVSKIVDSRNVLVSHSNWSLINGRRGQIENNVPARDVSPNNDWSEVRLWYHGIQALGGTHWPLNGFIYNDKPGAQLPKTRLARASNSDAFRKAFADEKKWLPSRKFSEAFQGAF